MMQLMLPSPPAPQSRPQIIIGSQSMVKVRNREAKHTHDGHSQSQLNVAHHCSTYSILPGVTNHNVRFRCTAACSGASLFRFSLSPKPGRLLRCMSSPGPTAPLRFPAICDWLSIRTCDPFGCFSGPSRSQSSHRRIRLVSAQNSQSMKGLAQLPSC
ncbi:hypothetical protein BGZ63DRAFT_51165 [Mariannaea sp. PMI_226]|nr:hypothetical protein BGZ63DRAFT_51165 [Mariannaea sp. PMI_226]